MILHFDVISTLICPCKLPSAPCSIGISMSTPTNTIPCKFKAKISITEKKEKLSKESNLFNSLLFNADKYKHILIESISGIDLKQALDSIMEQPR